MTVRRRLSEGEKSGQEFEAPYMCEAAAEHAWDDGTVATARRVHFAYNAIVLRPEGPDGDVKTCRRDTSSDQL